MKKEKRIERREIRDVLLGKMVLDEDGRLTTPEAGSIFLSQGVADGAMSVRLFGVKGKTRCYETDAEPEELLAEAAESMQSIGRALNLRTQPETVACLARYLLTRPAVLTFRYEEEQPVLTAWTGRGLFGWVSRLRAIRAFERRLSAELRPAAAEKPDRKRREPKAEQPEPAQSAEESPAEDWADNAAEDWADNTAENWTEDSTAEEWTENGQTAEQEDSEE